MMDTFGHGPSTIKLGDLEVCRLGFGAMQLPGKVSPANVTQALEIKAIGVAV
jgi:hypothetical protein